MTLIERHGNDRITLHTNCNACGAKHNAGNLNVLWMTNHGRDDLVAWGGKKAPMFCKDCRSKICPDCN